MLATSTDQEDLKMPSATKSIRSRRSDAVDQFNGRVVATGKGVGRVYLGGCMKTVSVAISAGRKTSGQPRKVASTLIGAQTAVAEKLTNTYTAMSGKVLAG
jgi:hypothetical protein